MHAQLSPDLAAAGDRLVRAFRPGLVWSDAIDGLRNLALFAGLGAVWVTTSTAPRLGTEIRYATLAGLGLSAIVEALQLFSPVRLASVLDLASNAGGTLAGAFGAALMIGATVRAKGARSYLGVPAFLWAGAYCVALLCEATTPLFRSEPDPGAIGGPLTRLRIMLALSVPLEAWQIPWLDVPLYAAAGFVALMWLAEGGVATGRGWPIVALAGAALAAVLEIGHGGLGLSVRWEALVVHVLAIAGGAAAARAVLPVFTQRWRGAARARLALAAYAALLLLFAWRPLWPRTSWAEITGQLSFSQFIPLASVAGRTDVFSALHVLQQFALYVPLGAVLAVWPLRLQGRHAHLRPAFLLALVFELGHIVIAERLFDITNVLLACAGVLLGWTVVRRAGFAPYGEALRPR